MRWHAFVSAVVVISVGSLLHFAWEWSGRSTLVSLFAAVNESTWEHLKLAFWPALMITPVQRLIYGPFPGWFVATTIRCLLPAILIVVLFYGYTALLGDNYLVADITIFAVAIVAGESLGHGVLDHQFSSKIRLTALGLTVLVTFLFSTLTFAPPDYFLFEDPHLH